MKQQFRKAIIIATCTAAAVADVVQGASLRWWSWRARTLPHVCFCCCFGVSNVNTLSVTLDVTFDVTLDVSFEVTFDVTFDVLCSPQAQFL